MTRMIRKNKTFIVFYILHILLLVIVVGFGCTLKNPNANNEQINISEQDTGLLHDIDTLNDNQINILGAVDSKKIDTFYSVSKECHSDLLFISVDTLKHFKIGSLEIKSTKLKGGTNSFEINRDSAVIYKSNAIAGISPLWRNDIYLLLCVYSSITEDGATEGLPLMVNILDGSVKQGKKTYSDCLNPVFWGGEIFLIEGLTLHILDTNLNERFQKNIEFIDTKKEERDYRYLDRFQFCYLNANKGQVFMGFKEEKTSANCSCFGGEISKNSDKILLYK